MVEISAQLTGRWRDSLFVTAVTVGHFRNARWLFILTGGCYHSNKVV